jgi:hypothetical protein
MGRTGDQPNRPLAGWRGSRSGRHSHEPEPRLPSIKVLGKMFCVKNSFPTIHPATGARQPWLPAIGAPWAAQRRWTDRPDRQRQTDDAETPVGRGDPERPPRSTGVPLFPWQAILEPDGRSVAHLGGTFVARTLPTCRERRSSQSASQSLGSSSSTARLKGSPPALVMSRRATACAASDDCSLPATARLSAISCGRGIGSSFVR